MRFALDLSDWPGTGGGLRWAPLPWDVEALGFPAYQLVVSGPPDGMARPLRDCLAGLARDETGRALAHVKVDAASTRWIAELCAAGFRPVETSLEPHRALAGFAPPPLDDALELGDMRPDELAPLCALAREAFAADRYHLEPAVPDEAAGRRYELWLRRAADAGERVHVLRERGGREPLGFFHVRDEGGGTVHLALAAVTGARRGAGLGRALYALTTDACARAGFQHARSQVSTSNLPGLNVFAALGYRFRAPTVCLHWAP